MCTNLAPMKGMKKADNAKNPQSSTLTSKVRTSGNAMRLVRSVKQE